MKKLLLSLLLCASGIAAMAQVQVTLTVTTQQKQKITGFGAAALENLMRPTQDVDIIRKAYEPKSPIGLNILRMEMSPNLKGDINASDIGWDTPYDWHGQLAAVREAKKHGALILASPWSPPGQYKTNGISGGGNSEDQGYVRATLKSKDKLFTWMNAFLKYMSDNDASVDVVSFQNEPDWWVSYSGCLYTPQEMHDVIAQYGSRLLKSKYNARLMGGEPLGFNPEYYRLLMQDDVTKNLVDMFGGHVYGGYDRMENIATTYGFAEGKEIWMTEHTVNPRGDQFHVRDLPTWHEELMFAEDVNECLVNGCNAYVYWYLCKDFGFIGDGTKYDQSECLSPGNDRGKILTRGYIMGQFARNLKGATQLVNTRSIKDGSNTPGVNQRLEFSTFKKGDSIIVNVIDTLSTQFKIKMNLPYIATSMKRIQSTEGNICVEDTPEIEPGKSFTFTVPGRSFTTFIYRVEDPDLVEAVQVDEREDEGDGECYSLSGQRIREPQRGIFIRNGRKYMR